jgi:hypothetical protein
MVLNLVMPVKFLTIKFTGLGDQDMAIGVRVEVVPLFC